MSLLTNSAFALTEEQLSAYNAWAEKMARAHAQANAADSLAVDITFTFTPFGRGVYADVSSSRRIAKSGIELEEL